MNTKADLLIEWLSNSWYINFPCFFLFFFCILVFLKIYHWFNITNNAHKTEYMCFNQRSVMSTLNGSSLKLVDKFTYLGSSFSLPETDIDMLLTKAWIAINRLSVIWKSHLTDKMKRCFFHAAIVSILLYGCTTWTLTKRMEKKLDDNYTRMLRAILNRSRGQHLTKKQLYGHLSLIAKAIQIRRTRHAGHCWRSRNKLIRDVLLWTPSHGQAGRSAWTYIQQLCENTACSHEDLPEARKRVWDILVDGTTRWWISSPPDLMMVH